MSGNVVELRQRDQDDDAPVRRRPRPRGRYCRHFKVELDAESRRVYCRDCEQEVPAFDYLVTLAGHFEQYTASRDRAQGEADRVQARLEELKREERNAKARKRRRERAA